MSAARDAMQTTAVLVALLVTATGAAGDESRNVPAVGSKLTYRSVSTTTIPRATLTTGESPSAYSKSENTTELISVGP